MSYDREPAGGGVVGTAVDDAQIYEFEGSIEGELVRPDGDLIILPADPPARTPRMRRALRLERRASRWLVTAVALEEAGADGALAEARGLALSDRAVDTWRRALGSPRVDAPAVHVRLGFLLDARGRPDEAAAEWREGLARAPEGSLADDARVALGDRAFDEGDVFGAAALYAAATDDPEVGAYAWYRLAWCRHNVAEDEGAVLAMLEAIAAGEGLLVRGARSDLARFAANLPDGAVRAATGRACGGDAACVAELLDVVDHVRADVALPPVVRTR